MNALLILAGLVLLLVVFVFLKVIRSENYVKQYCLILFQNKQKNFLSKIRLDSRLAELDSNQDAHEKLTEILQEHLWSKSKQLDDSFNKKNFNLEIIIEISYIVWLIYFVNKKL